ncbi:MAG: radical SAM protein, partial [Bacteroidales bacterium]|nr:radical SAM protein [Bacteroidales bacterium]
MIQRCYLEITNICNLDCAFCAKTKRAKALMSGEQFEQLTDKLQGKIQFLYFHLMGEPCLHPQLADFVERAKEKGFTPVITTNGTRLSQ